MKKFEIVFYSAVAMVLVSILAWWLFWILPKERAADVVYAVCRANGGVPLKTADHLFYCLKDVKP